MDALSFWDLCYSSFSARDLVVVGGSLGTLGLATDQLVLAPPLMSPSRLWEMLSPQIPPQRCDLHPRQRHGRSNLILSLSLFLKPTLCPCRLRHTTMVMTYHNLPCRLEPAEFSVRHQSTRPLRQLYHLPQQQSSALSSSACLMNLPSRWARRCGSSRSMMMAGHCA